MTRAREEQIIEAAYKEAKARGLPDGWTCTIDVSCCPLFLLISSPLSGSGSHTFSLMDLLETQTPEMDSPQSWQIV